MDHFRATHSEAPASRRERPWTSILGTALASDPTLVGELESVRIASANGLPTPGTLVPTPRGGRAIAATIVLVFAFLAIWQLLQPGERHPPVMTDQQCQALKGCRAFGSCKAEGYRCVAATDDDCKQSELCTKLGRCTEVGGACYGPNDNVGESSRSSVPY